MRQNLKMKVLGLHLQNFLDFFTLQGLSQPPLKEKFNLPDLDLCDNTVYIDVELYLKVLNHMVQRLDDKALGVKYGRYLNLKSLGLIYEISMKVSNIQEALFYLNEYVDNTFPLIQVVLRPDPNRDNGFELTMQYRGEYGDPASRCLLEPFTLVVYRELSAMGSHHEHSLKVLFDRCCSSSAPSDLPVIFASQYGVSAERYNLEHSLDGLKKIKLGELIPAFFWSK